MTADRTDRERKTIAKLEADPSKAQEIEFIEAIADSVPANAYLKGLFTPDLIGWIGFQIRSDFPCDIHATLEDTRNRMQADISALQLRARDHQHIQDKLGESNESLLATIRDNGDTIIKLGNERRELADKLNLSEITMNYKERQHKQVFIELERTIVELKAKLYDAGTAMEELRNSQRLSDICELPD